MFSGEARGDNLLDARGFYRHHVVPIQVMRAEFCVGSHVVV